MTLQHPATDGGAQGWQSPPELDAKFYLSRGKRTSGKACLLLFFQTVFCESLPRCRQECREPSVSSLHLELPTQQAQKNLTGCNLQTIARRFVQSPPRFFLYPFQRCLHTGLSLYKAIGEPNRSGKFLPHTFSVRFDLRKVSRRLEMNNVPGEQLDETTSCITRW